MTDASRGVVPHAAVQVTNQATNISKTAGTDANGNYEVTHLNAGVYTVTVEAAGFKRFVHRGVLLEALGAVRIDASLEVGQVATEVTVTAAGPVVESETASVAQMRSNRQLQDLPLNLRGGNILYEFTRLTPTAYQGGGSRRAMGGGRGSSSYFSVDGISANSPAFGNQLAILQPAAEAIQELRFEYVNSAAEFGEIANVTAVTKSGSNNFHGTAFWYHDNSRLAARNLFSPTKGPVDPRTGQELNFTGNTFGGSLGGPIRRKKAFFFAAYQWNRDNTPSVTTPSLPTLKMRNGDFSELLALSRPIPVRDPLTGQPFAGNLIARERLYRGSLAWQERFFPQPNFGPPESFTNNFRKSLEQETTQHRLDTRSDYYISDRNTLWVRFSYSRNFPGNVAYFDAGGNAVVGDQIRTGPQFALSETWTVSPRLINEIKLGYSMNHNRFGGPLAGQQVIDELGIQGLARQPGLVRTAGVRISRIPAVQITGFHSPSQDVGDQVEETFQVMDQLSLRQGRHSLKTGFEWRPQRYKGARFPDFGTYSFTSRFSGFAYSDFLLGLPESAIRRSQRPTWYARFWFLDGFVQDDFKVSTRLTLNLGLRWEYNAPVWDKFDIFSNFDPRTGGIVLPSEAVIQKVPAAFPRQVPIISGPQAGFPARALRRDDRNNFAPRFGFAFRPFGNASTAIRGSYGIYYDDLTADFAGAFFVSRTPFDFQERFVNEITGGAPLLTFQRAFLEAGSLGALSLSGTAQDIRNPYMQQWTFSVERDIGFETSLRLSYLGTKTTSLIHRRDINKPPATTVPFSQSRRPYPLYQDILFAQNGANQIYNAFSAHAERRMTRGLYFQANWTWAKALTDGDEDQGVEGGPTLENPYDRSRDRADARFAPRRRFNANAIWELPFGRGKRYGNRPGLIHQVVGGWELSATYIAQTGEYLTPTFSGADPSNTRTLGGRADRIADGNLPEGQRSINRWFDTGAFAVPPNGRFGNSARSVIVGPGRNVLNLGAFKSFTITESSALRFQITATNAFNHPNFAAPALNISAPRTVGTISALESRDFAGPRKVLLGLRYEF